MPANTVGKCCLLFIFAFSVPFLVLELLFAPADFDPIEMQSLDSVFIVISIVVAIITTFLYVKAIKEVQ